MKVSKLGSLRVNLRKLGDLKIPRCVTSKGTIKKFEFLSSLTQVKKHLLVVCTPDNNHGWRCSSSPNRCKNEGYTSQNTTSTPSWAAIGVKLLQSLKAALKASSMAKLDRFSWTDFTFVLQWLAQLPRKWTTFVANRVSQIQEIMPRENRKHVPTKENPADIALRGTHVQELINSSLWWKGPDFLPGETIICPPQPEYTNNAPEQRTTAKVHEIK